MKKAFKILAVVMALVLIGTVFAACGKKTDGEEKGKVTAKVIDIKLSDEQYAFAVNPNNAELLEKVNKFLAEIITSAVEDKTKDQLIVVTEPGFEPFEYTIGDKFAGIDMEIAKLLADSLGKELVIKTIDFDSIFSTLNTNGADIGMAGITVSPDREKLVKFSDSYYNASQELIVKSTDTKFDNCKTADDVAKLLKELPETTKIGVQSGTTGNAYVDGSEDLGFDGLTAKATPYTNGSLAVTAMLNGDVDYVIIDEAPAKRITKAVNAMQ